MFQELRLSVVSGQTSNVVSHTTVIIFLKVKKMNITNMRIGSLQFSTYPGKGSRGTKHYSECVCDHSPDGFLAIHIVHHLP